MKRSSLFMGLGLGAAAATFGAVLSWIVRGRGQVHEEFADTLSVIKANYDLCAKKIREASKEIADDEIVYAADRMFAEAVNRGVEFTNAFDMPFGFIDDAGIESMSAETLRAYIESLRGAAQIARRYLDEIEAAREKMLAAYGQEST